MNWLIKNWPSLAIFIAGVIGAYATFIASSRTRTAQELMKNLTVEVKNIGLHNTEITNQVRILSELNNSIGEKNSKLVAQNIELTTAARDLIEKVQKLTSATHALTSSMNVKTDNERAKNAVTGEINLITDEQLFPEDIVTFVLGGTNFGNPIKAWNAGASFGLIEGYEPIKFKIKNNAVLISLECYDKDGYYIGEIDENKWRRNPNYTSKFNYDKKGVEIIDNKNQVAFSIDILDSHRLLLQGVIGVKQKNSVIIIGMKSMNVKSLGYPSLQEIINKAGIKQLFEYTGKNYLGVRKKD